MSNQSRCPYCGCRDVSTTHPTYKKSCLACGAEWDACEQEQLETIEVRRAIFDWGQAHGYTLIESEINDLLNRIEKARQ